MRWSASISTIDFRHFCASSPTRLKLRLRLRHRLRLRLRHRLRLRLRLRFRLDGGGVDSDTIILDK